MDATQLTPILCIIAAVAIIFYFRTWWSVVIAVLLLLLIPAVTANATTKIQGGPATVPNHRYCNWFRVQEQRYGALDSQLWDLQEKVTWCINANHSKVNYLRRTWGYKTGIFWSLHSHVLSGSKASDDSWYSRRVSAEFHGYVPALAVHEVNRPFVKIKVYANARGHVSYDTGCGC